MSVRSALVPCALAFGLVLAATPTLAVVSGYSTVGNCGEAGNWIEVTFTCDTGATLVDAHWDFSPTNVWLDPTGTSMCSPINNGVSSATVYREGPAGQPTQVFGITATGFDSGDLYRFSADLDYGSTGSPFTTQYYGGTVTVEFSDGTIATGTFDTPYDEPNGARAALASTGPNFNFTARAGWYEPVVPRSDNTATWASVPVPPVLVGESADTWLSAATYNAGTTLAGSSTMTVQIDGDQVCSHNLWVVSPGQYNGWVNDGALTVRGGRHTVVAYADANGVVNETDETDNVFAKQWSWEPMVLPLQQIVTRSAPPPAAAGTEYLDEFWWNCDGVRLAPVADRPWNAVWMEPLNPGPVDYRLRLHPHSTGPEDGFGWNLAITWGDEDLAAILLNARSLTAPDYDLGVLNFDHRKLDVDYRVLHLGSSPYPFGFGIFPETPYFATRLMTFDFFASIGSQGPASLVVEANPAEGPVHLGWLGPDFMAGSLRDVQDVVSTGDLGWAVLNLDLDQIGHHCAVVWSDRFAHPTGLAVRVGLFHGRPDLQPATLAGWYAPVVPRPTDDALLFSCPEPDTLHGSLPLTWLNTVCMNGGSADADTVSFQLRLDGAGLVGIRNTWLPLPPGQPRTVMNLADPGAQQPWSIPGGRHTLSVQYDYLDDVAELLENNNFSGRQYCWSPRMLPPGGVLTRSGVPAQNGGQDDCEPSAWLYPNCDGLRLQYRQLGDIGLWRAAAVMPVSGTGNPDVELHLPLAGTNEGFGPHRVAESRSGPGDLDFVLVCYRNAAPTAYDVGVFDGTGNAGAGYTVQDELSTYQGALTGGELGPFRILAGNFIALHEMWLPAGDMTLRVDDLGDDVDWGLSVYRADEEFFGKMETVPGGYGESHGHGGSEWVQLSLPADDHYCVTVWKAHADDLEISASYRLWLTPGASSTPEVVRPATKLTSASPNPFNPQTTIRFELAAAGPCRLTIHDLQGRIVRTLVTGERSAGLHEEIFDGRDDLGHHLASGVYLMRLEAGAVSEMQKLTLVK